MDEADELPFDWREISRIDAKRRLYDRDVYFRQGLADLLEIAGTQPARQLLSRLGLLLIKPDGLLAGKAGFILDFVSNRGFRLVNWASVEFTPHVWRELWRYQLNAATLDRLAVNELLLQGPALLLLLSHEDSAVPAAVRLSGMKGSSDISLQTDQCLRRHLGQPNRVLSLMHVADEPADLVRELAIVLDTRERRRSFWQKVVSGRTPEAGPLEELVARSSRNARSIDSAEALDRLDRVLDREAPPGEDRQLALEAIGRMREGRKIAWRDFQSRLERLGIVFDRWDLAVLGSGHIHTDRHGVPKLIGAGTSELWADE